MHATPLPTADLADEYGDHLRVCDVQFTSYGAVRSFSGPIRTVVCHDDNALLQALLREPGNGHVVVVDGRASLHTALLGDLMAERARDNGWAGVVIHGAIRDVVESDFRAGCPVLAVSVEEPAAGEVPPALAAAAEAFEDWERLLAEALREHGADPERAPGLAALIVASVEGAIAMCRAKRSMRPLDQVAQQLETLIAGALDRAA
ncbi:LmrA/YxaF family transcription factor [Streptomyces bluensis]|uniref:Putative 4-hydroxy-4-methyl-2-oxoglutarate aldolase n=1 Tax=Streptomyces bluensis TaxID=33897 RepID=A0ABW6UC09_9ACTN